ncbi:uncharacterized protein LOC116804977 [Drosophila grimshawi]|uniref:uncharacterized protein LOC116804977 n=1 Tax=Drosophila grimshawi TaxID=7222 RepID=UPI0013EF31D0|nr:uncharacterized protein LOC116804977 [Drosophila grimshawi]
MMNLQIWIVSGLSVLIGFSTPQTLIGDQTNDLTHIPYPGDCNLYYEKRTLSCPPESCWKPQLQRCEIKSIIKPTNFNHSSNSTSSRDEHIQSLFALCAAQKEVFIPFPGDCTRFIQCDYLPFVKICPPFLYWNSKLLTCDKICL